MRAGAVLAAGLSACLVKPPREPLGVCMVLNPRGPHLVRLRRRRRVATVVQDNACGCLQNQRLCWTRCPMPDRRGAPGRWRPPSPTPLRARQCCSMTHGGITDHSKTHKYYLFIPLLIRLCCWTQSVPNQDALRVAALPVSILHIRHDPSRDVSP